MKQLVFILKYAVVDFRRKTNAGIGVTDGIGHFYLRKKGNLHRQVQSRPTSDPIIVPTTRNVLFCVAHLIEMSRVFTTKLI